MAGAQSRAGDTGLRQLHPPHPPSGQLLKPKGRAHREGPGPQLFNPPPLWAAPSLGSAGGTCTWPGQEGKVTHTKFNNQQRQEFGRPRPRPARPSCSPRAVSSPEPNTLLGQKREGLPLRQSLSAPSVAASWTVGGGHGRQASASCPPHGGCNCGVLLPRPRPGPGPPQSSLSLGRLTIAAVSELAVLGNLQFGGVGGGDAVTGLHAVPLFQLRQGAHEAGVGGVQGGDALLLWTNRA